MAEQLDSLPMKPSRSCTSCTLVTTRLLGWSSVKPPKCTWCGHQHLCNNSIGWPLLLHVTAPHCGWYRHSQRCWRVTIKAQKETGFPTWDSGISLFGFSEIWETRRIPLLAAYWLQIVSELLQWCPCSSPCCKSLSGDQWQQTPQAGALSASSLQPTPLSKEGDHDSGHIPEATL